ADRNRSHWSTSKTPSYTKSVSWQHHPGINQNIQYLYVLIFIHFICEYINQWNTCVLIISKGFE
ncbi:hypothetical protein, partial [Escherichia coli]|uniref:hypothetical protein n=1 Tax=Escherichia coli TaxID=562 RepID=UPI00289933C4